MKWGITMITKNTEQKPIYGKKIISEEYIKFWLRMEVLFGRPIHAREIDRIKERMYELEKETLSENKTPKL